MTEIASRRLRVFLCHSSGDKPTVRELYQKLSTEGWIDAWLDEEKLYPGQDWNYEIERAVEAADVIIVCLTQNSVNKEGYIQRELRHVLDQADYKPEGTLFIIPIRLEECEPPRRLSRWQYADYFPPSDRNRADERLLVSLRRRAKVLGIFREGSQSDFEPKLNLSEKPNAEPSPAGLLSPVDLEVVDVEAINGRSNIQAFRKAWFGEFHEKQGLFPLIDIKLRNISASPAFLKRIEFDVERAYSERDLDLHGASMVSWEYSVLLDPHKEKERITLPISQVVEPNSVDRFVVVIGQTRTSGRYRYVEYKMKLRLFYNVSGVINLGELDIKMEPPLFFSPKKSIGIKSIAPS